MIVFIRISPPYLLLGCKETKAKTDTSLISRISVPTARATSANSHLSVCAHEGGDVVGDCVVHANGC